MFVLRINVFYIQLVHPGVLPVPSRSCLVIAIVGTLAMQRMLIRRLNADTKGWRVYEASQGKDVGRTAVRGKFHFVFPASVVVLRVAIMLLWL